MTFIQRIIDFVLNFDPGEESSHEIFARTFGLVELKRMRGNLLVLNSPAIGDVEIVLPFEYQGRQKSVTVLFQTPVVCRLFDVLSELNSLGQFTVKPSVKYRRKNNGFSICIPNNDVCILFDLNKKTDEIQFYGILFAVKSVT